MVSIIAEEYQIVLIIAQQDPCAGRLRREGLAVQVVHGKIKHRVEVHDIRYLGVDCLELVERCVPAPSNIGILKQLSPWIRLWEFTQ